MCWGTRPKFSTSETARSHWPGDRPSRARSEHHQTRMQVTGAYLHPEPACWRTGTASCAIRASRRQGQAPVLGTSSLSRGGRKRTGNSARENMLSKHIRRDSGMRRTHLRELELGELVFPGREDSNHVAERKQPAPSRRELVRNGIAFERDHVVED